MDDQATAPGAGGAGVGQAVDVGQMGADAALAKLVQPAVLGDESEPVQHLHVANIEPEANEAGRVAGQELVGLVDGGKLVVVEAVFKADGDATVGGVVGDVREGAAGRGGILDGAAG